MKCAVSALGIILFILCLFGFGLQRADAATTWYVDDDALADFDTIQAAIDASSDGDTIIVRDGTYTGDGNRDIDFNGKAVHLRSENGPEGCIIDAQGSEAELHRGFYFHSGEDESSVVDGFTIRNGHLFDSKSEEQQPGAGICCLSASPTITNNIITANTADSYGGGIYCQDNSSPTVDNTILWGNSASQGSEIGLYSPSILTARYCDVAGGAGAAHVDENCTLDLDSTNTDVAPLFADPDNGDYHLKSEHGRWNPNANGGAGDWVLDNVTSLCVNGGDPASDFSNEPMFNGGRINVGAYGNTPEASKNRWLITTDANFDEQVDVLDLLTVRDKLQQDPTSGNNWRCDVNTDGFINILDLIYVRNHLRTRRE